jgi:hypothetical protein
MPALTFDDLLGGGGAGFVIPDWLDKSLEWQESRGNPNAVSPRGAFGRRQLMPATAADPGFGIKPFDVNAPDQDAENVRLGRDYFGKMLERYGGDEQSALVAYNWGPGNADKWVAGGKDFNKLPRETKQYVTNILASRPAETPAASSGALTFDDLLGGQQPQQADVATQPEGRSWGGFVDNAGKNIADIASNTYNAFSENPAQAALAVGRGAADFIMPGIQQSDQAQSQSMATDFGFENGQFDKKRLANNIYERPVDLLLDASAVLPFGANPITRGASAVAKVGAVPAKAAKYVVGETSGLGPKAIEEAYRSGRVGGAQGEAFRAGMRGTLDPDTPVDVGRAAVQELKADRKAEYLQGKDKWAGNDKPLAWDPIEAAFESTMGIKRFRGKDLKPSVANARDQVRAVLDEWKADPGSWTAEGFDALKQRLEDIRQGLNPLDQGAARSMVGATIAAVKRQIVKQAPSYAASMKAYERASTAIDEVQRTLSLGSKSSYDTALRKLQSVLRNNAFTNWSARAKLAELISKKAPELMPMLSGMAASTWTPRGLPGKLLGPAGIGAAGVAGGLSLAALPGMVAAGAAASPRIVGEVAHGLGRARGAISQAATINPMVAYLLSLGQGQ